MDWGVKITQARGYYDHSSRKEKLNLSKKFYQFHIVLLYYSYDNLLRHYN